MRKKIITGICLLALSLNISLKAQTADTSQDWTLDQCISYALQNNIQILKSGLNIDEAQIDLKESKAQLFPSLTFNTSQNISFEKNDSETAIYAGSYNLDASMTIYNGGRNLKTIKQNNLQVENSRYNYLYTANSIELSIIKAYYQILYAKESVKTNQEIVSTSLKQLERSKEMFNVGEISKVDLAQMESQYKSDMYQLVSARTAEQESLLSLKQLLELNVAADFNIAGIKDEEVLAEVPAQSDIIQTALASLPEMKSANTELKIAQLSKQIASAERIPTVTLRGSIGTGHSSIADYNWGKQMTNGLNENIGVTVSVPILNNRSTKSKKERADISILNSQLNINSTIRDISNTIASLHLDAVSAQSRYEAALANVISSTESYDLVEEKYNIGLQSLVDLLVEKNNYLSAKQEELQSKYTALLDLRLIEFYMNRE